MKKNDSQKSKIFPKYLIITLGCISGLLWYATGYASYNIVYQAYQLRMQGMADSARTILETSLVEDSTNAAVWYEYARTKHQIGLGNPHELFAGLDDLQRAIKKAIDIHPDNVIYAYYNGYICFTQAYLSLMRDPTNARGKVGEAVSAYELVLKLKPDYKEAMLTLVEVLALPEDMGGNSSKAQTYADKLDILDPIYGAKARELLLPDSVNKVEFWQGILETYPDHPDILEQLGKAYLYTENADQGLLYLEDAIKIDPGKKLLLLDMARFHFMTSRKDTSMARNALPRAEDTIKSYLDTNPIAPLHAFAVNMLAMIKFSQGLSNEGKEYQRQAKNIDPNVSQASAIPPAVLFEKPNQISHYFSYFFRPF